MIEPLRPEIESAQANLPPPRPAVAMPEQRNGGRINFPSRPSIQAAAPSATTRSAAWDVSTPNSSANPAGETAQISVLPDRPKFTNRRHFEDRSRKHPENKIFIDTIPVPLCWGLLGISAAILLIEIWNYIS